jgi:thiosulfate dehydrogenase [quinone] large subunit
MSEVAFQAPSSRVSQFSPPPISALANSDWYAASLALLSVRFIQGFIYWGGGSRRYIYAPSKLDPHASTWMANKFQSAMPGALLGMDHVIAFMLQHFWILYPAVLLFSAAELFAGLFLMLGLFTRAAALVSAGFSIVLMLMFGWQGATCIDEWTMAACNLAIGVTLAIAGSGAFSLDNLWLTKRPTLARKSWFRWASGALPLPLSPASFQKLALVALAATAIFNVTTYDHFRGSVYSAFHKGPVSPSAHHYTLNGATIDANGALSFHAYLDGGSPEVASHIVAIDLEDANGEIVRHWDMSALTQLPSTAIRNDFAYNKITTAPYGLAAEMGAMATITLEGLPASAVVKARQVSITNVSGRKFKAAIGAAQNAPT